MRRSVITKVLHLCAATTVAGMLASCASLEERAPLLSTLGVSAGAPSGSLALGRDIYVTKCGRCHAVEPVRKYSAAHWREIMPEMADKSKLSAGEVSALEAYVLAVLKAPAPRA